jgi:hypothetical protein
MYVCILDHEGRVLLHQNMPCDPQRFLRAVAPYRDDDLVVAVECIFTWYWLADLCAKEGIAFVLGHALYMKAIHGAKAKNDRVDAAKIAALLKGGLLPQAYVYPSEMRATRNAHLKWAFSEAAVLFLAKCPEGKKLMARLEKRHGKGKALSILAHRIGRAVYFMLKNKRAFDLERFLRM